MESLKYRERLMYMEGCIVSVQDGAVTMDLKGRLGTLKVPKRMLISDVTPMPGQDVGFMMGYPEIVQNAHNREKENVYEL